MNTQIETERQISNDGPRLEYATPLASVTGTADGYKLCIEMPGVTKDGIEVSVENNELTVTGRRHHQETPGEVWYREIRGQDYRRVFELDPALDNSRIEAKMENGVLTLWIPKGENLKPRKIVVQD